MIDPTDWLLAAAAIAAAILAIWRVILPTVAWLKRVGARANRALDVLLGAPEIVDPDRPGEVLRPAVPDIGVRVTGLESTLAVTVFQTVEEAKAAAREAAQAAATSAAAAESAATSAASALNVVAAVEHLPEQFAELRAEVAQWHGVDRVKASFADAMVVELGRTTSTREMPPKD